MWVAFANLAVPSESITAYARTRHGLAAIEGAVPVSPLGVASADEAGAPLKIASWRMDAAWALNAMAAQPVWGWRPTAQVYGSGRGGDQGVGQIAAEFDAPENKCVILPLFHGPSVSGASAQLIDADSQTVLADVPFRDSDVLWLLWQVKLNPAVKHLRFVTADHGSDWGQWLAVGAPLACK
jgi:hypothetical protein